MPNKRVGSIFIYPITYILIKLVFNLAISNGQTFTAKTFSPPLHIFPIPLDSLFNYITNLIHRIFPIKSTSKIKASLMCFCPLDSKVCLAHRQTFFTTCDSFFDAPSLQLQKPLRLVFHIKKTSSSLLNVLVFAYFVHILHLLLSKGPFEMNENYF